MLELTSVQVGYGNHVVLRDISFTVAPGQVLAVLGTNGAGKSTLLRSIAGLQPLQSGTITFEGAALGRLPAFRRVRGGLALAPEGQQSFPYMSVRENLLVAARTAAPRAAAAELDEAILGVEEYFPKLRARARQSAGSLSGGERQMLSISRALLARPRLLMLDEPSHGLAPIIVEEVAEIVGRLAQITAILLVEQNLAIPKACATDVLVLENSHIVARGGPELMDGEDVVRSYLGM